MEMCTRDAVPPSDSRCPLRSSKQLMTVAAVSGRSISFAGAVVGRSTPHPGQGGLGKPLGMSRGVPCTMSHSSRLPV